MSNVLDLLDKKYGEEWHQMSAKDHCHRIWGPGQLTMKAMMLGWCQASNKQMT